MKQILITNETLTITTRKELGPNNGTPLTRPDEGHSSPDGYTYVNDVPRPAEAPQEGYRWKRATPTLEEYGWEEVAIPTIVPTPVSMAQFREELSKPTYNNEAGVTMRVIVQQAVNASGIVMQDWWDTASVVERYNAKVLAMAEALGVSDETLDAIFTGANLN